MAGPTAAFWQARFEEGSTPWDRGRASPQLERWLDEKAFASGASVLVPGCGSGYEVAALAAAGMSVAGIDYAKAAVERTQKRLAAIGGHAQIVQADVLQWAPEDPVTAVYEQTCLCALHPDHWTAYSAQLHAWLRPGGNLFALFMQLPRPTSDQGFVVGPPYHCDINAMRALFPGSRWEWPKPPYERVSHPNGAAELAVVLKRI